MTTFRQPATTGEELAQLGGDASLICGGTDVLVRRRARSGFGTLVDLSNLADAPPAVTHGDGVIVLSSVGPARRDQPGAGDCAAGATDGDRQLRLRADP